MVMQTRCPACNTLFKVSKPQLLTANGQVRCGHCGHIFNGYDNLQSSSNTHLSSEAIKHMLLGKPSSTPKDLAFWLTGITLALLLLLAQLAYLQRDSLAQIPSLSAMITTACANIQGCELSAQRDLSRLQLVSRNVYSHPNINGALMVNAIITNTADFEQPYPVLLVSMSNVRGKVVGERYFRPDEYLGNTEDTEGKMPIGKHISVSLEVMDPGQNALAFELDFF